MARITLLESQTLNMAYNEDYGMVMCVLSKYFALTNGETHTVVWDGEEYSCEPFAITNVSNGVGNPVVVGDADNGMPFAVISVGGTEVLVGAIYDQTPTTHTLAIYQGEADSSANDIIVKDRTGNNVTHKSVSRIRTRTTDGGTKEFVDADNIPNPVATTVELDFSSGDMEVLPGAGEVFSEVSIPKPVNLVPENIAEGVDIAGIIGSLAGGGSNVVYKFGTFTGNGGAYKLSHGLGVIPDVFVCRSKTSLAGENYQKYIQEAHGYSKNLRENLGVIIGCNHIKMGTGYRVDGPTHHDVTSTTFALNNATDNTITIGNSTYPTFSGFIYHWLAIGGLT